MRAIRMHDFGGPEALRMDDIPVPEPGPQEWLVQVRAASVNPIDYKIRSGAFRAVERGQLPRTLGRDLSGTVVRCGPDASGYKEGDPVFALIGLERGSYADYAIVRSGELAARPAKAELDVAAAIPLAGLTAWQGLFDYGHLKQGQRVLIHGGAGGVGHFAVQFAKAKNAEVLATVGTEDIAFAKSLGADRVIDYRRDRFEDIASDIDLVYDLVGGDTRERSWSVLKTGGTMVSTLGEPDQAKAAAHKVRAVGYMARPVGDQLASIAALIDDGKVRVEVSRRFPLESAGEAQRVLEHEHLRGKVLLEVAPPN